MKNKIRIARMPEKGSKYNDSSVDDNSSVISAKYISEERIYHPKLLRHSPSLKAIKAYNDLPVEGSFEDVIDTSMFVMPRSPRSFSRKYEQDSTISRDSLGSDTRSTENMSCEYATVGTLSNSGSDLNSEVNDMGSTAKLMSAKIGHSWQTWGPYVTTTICTTCMAAGFGNLYRLPQSTLIRGGLPFLVVYIGLTIFVGLPLLFLELGMGQIAQEGVIKTWRAVPFFKGIGYVKLLACCLLSIYYPIYIGLALYYIIWMLRGPVPFRECSKVTLTPGGYSTTGKSAQECLRITFLKNPIEDLYWYGIFVALLLVAWIIITALSIRKTRSYIKGLVVLLTPIVGCYLFLFIKSILLQSDTRNLYSFFSEADWTTLKSAKIWYYASVQVFFSTNVGFGSFTTNAGIIYNKVSPLWTALGYITINTLFGFGSVVISQALTNLPNVDSTLAEGDIAELHLTSLIYDIGSSSQRSDLNSWAIVFYLVIILSGFVSMGTVTYTLLKAITVQSRNSLKWWHACVVLSFVAYIIGCLALLQPNFDLIHLLDHYIVGNLIFITSILEILVLIAFYGMEKIRSDFEFMIGHLLSRLWLLLWWLIPVFLTAVFAWAMISLPLEGVYKADAAWLYGVGWGVVLSSIVFIFAVGFYVVSRQDDGYTWIDKFKASLKPSNNWGPKDPMSRHNWMQWNSQSQEGERDFTLKRKGTRDYTRSIKKNKKVGSSELSTLSMQGIYKSNDRKQSISSISDGNIYSEVDNPPNMLGTLRVTSLPNTPDLKRDYEINGYDKQIRVTSLPNRADLNENFMKKNMNPLAHFDRNKKFHENGTLRKGPYVISEPEIGHVCHRKTSEISDVTEL